MTKKLFILVILGSVAVSAFTQSVDPAWVMRDNGPGDAGGAANAVTLDDSGIAYLTGSGSNYQCAIIKHVQFLWRDANKGGVVGVGGVVYLIDYLFKGGPQLEC